VNGGVGKGDHMVLLGSDSQPSPAIDLFASTMERVAN
jgi:hypothetical protein